MPTFTCGIRHRQIGGVDFRRRIVGRHHAVNRHAGCHHDDADEDRADFEKFFSVQSIHRSPPYSCE
ncbi:MAG: hypothetical protein MPW16_15815 [Candidatus Manganitrophus sp.]|nr:MAG: hypothetical protein MPW16_15815 [Candidatus Manganitrophus sp.]